MRHESNGRGIARRVQHCQRAMSGVAAGPGVAWIGGWLLCSAGYMADPGKRSTGFMIQALAVGALLLGALGRIVYSLAVGG